MAPITDEDRKDSAFNMSKADTEKGSPVEGEIDTGSLGVVPMTVGVGLGNGWHMGFHMCTSVAGSALLGLPYAMALLGWEAGIIVLLLGYATTFWTSWIIAEMCNYGGKRHLRYRDLAAAVFGKRWGPLIVWPCQWANLIGAAISVYIQAGLSFKAIYSLCGGTSLTLTEFIAIFGGFTLLFTQLPTFHSLRYLNLLNMLNTYLFTLTAVVIAIYQAAHYHVPRDYGVHGSSVNKLFGFFQGIVIMSFTYGNTIIPEIQATAKPPAVTTMRKGIFVLYAQLAATYFPSAIVGYACYGQALVPGGGSFLPFFQASVPDPDHPSPKGGLVFINILTLFNAVCGILIYSAPVTEHAESHLLDSKAGLWNFRNWLKRTVLRCFYLFLLAFIAAMFPYFGDILGLIGALGITPIDFMLPLTMYLMLKKPKGLALVLNWALLILYTCIGVLGAIASIRGIVKDVGNYSVFPNL